MSSALVKRSLALFTDDFKDEPSKKKKTREPMALISTKKQGVKKELRKLQKERIDHQKRKKNIAFNSNKEAKDYCDYTEQSVQALTRLSQIDSSDKSTSKIVFEHHQKGKRKPTSSDQVGHQEEKTAFTDKDFEEFFNTYDFSKLQKKS